MSKYFCAAAFAAALCANSVTPSIAAKSAAETEKKLRGAFAEADLDGDGNLDIDEYVGYVVRLFTSLDKNRDGFLEPNELPNTTDAKFKEVDRNGDGKISLGEGVGDKVIDFFDADTDHNGVMSLAELLDHERRESES
jgi:Ca2+-binding EF-hand superfamily protein